ncbi:MAG: MBL fold metallo-hydrolase [Treponema sp.]|nr:MBL fold metallo-hydrolase [Treponema sp.]
MKICCHYCRSAFSNCYIVGSETEAETEKPRSAIIIDPGEMDLRILKFIEDNEYALNGIFITHDHPANIGGLQTVMRIYNTEIYAINPTIKEYRTTLVRDGDTVSVGSFTVEVILIPGHSADSAVFKIDRLLFTGDALSAGLIGSTASSYAAATQVSALRSKIFSLPGDFAVLPSSGPPTTLKAEQRFNWGITSFEEQKKRRRSFKIDL